MEKILTNLAGLSFRSAEAKEAVRALVSGDSLDLERDRDNPYDENAIRILRNGQFLGFVERMVNESLAAGMDRGRTVSAKVLKVYDPEDPDDPKRWMRPLIEIVLHDAAAA